MAISHRGTDQSKTQFRSQGTTHVLARNRVGTATIDITLPHLVRPGESVDATLEVWGGTTDQVLDALGIVLRAGWTPPAVDDESRHGALGPAGSPSIEVTGTTLDRSTAAPGGTIIQSEPIATDLRIAAADHRVVDTSFMLAPFVPLSLGSTRVSVSVVPTPTARERDTPLRIPETPLAVRPTKAMGTCLDAIRDLGFTCFDTRPIPGSGRSRSSTPARASDPPRQTLEFARIREGSLVPGSGLSVTFEGAEPSPECLLGFSGAPGDPSESVFDPAIREVIDDRTPDRLSVRTGVLQ
ncbi:MAG: sporulation protein [Halodesulfurarchaeum sp.]